MTASHYTFKDKPPQSVRDALHAYDELTQDMLYARGIATASDAQAFFSPDYDRDIHDPFLLTDMDAAVVRIIRAVDDGEHIGIYTDFDADGIPAGALLHDAFVRIGHDTFTNYIPHRDTEGYGFHMRAVDTLKEKGVTLIITADVGITDVETVAYAREQGIDVIVTDHHLPGDVLPGACAVVNPQRLDDFYPNMHLCGSGVAFKLVQALYARARETEKAWIRDVPVGWEKWLLDYVAIATVADMMPLVGENRTLVHFGLFVLRKTQRPGIVALVKRLRLAKPFITEDDIGFSIGPRINASSRMGSPEVALELFTTTDEGRAQDLAKQLDALNNKRKGVVAGIVRELKKRLSDTQDHPVLVAGNPSWNPALLGLAANSLVDAYGKTVCVWGREGTGNIKGSCRGAGDVNIVDLFTAARDALTQFGGHEHAGGFSIAHEDVHTLQETFSAAYDTVKRERQERAVVADAPLRTTALRDTHSCLTKFAPFGIGNEKPLFTCERVSVVSVRQFGTDDAHIEVQIGEDEFSPTVRAIAFFKQAESFTKHPVVGETITLLGSLELSRFGGRVSYEMRIVDIV